MEDRVDVSPGAKDSLGRVVIYPDRSSWYTSKDVAYALQESVRRLYQQPWHSWKKILDLTRQAMFDEFKRTLKHYLSKAKKDKNNVKDGSLHTEGAKSIGTISRKMEKTLGRPPNQAGLFRRIHIKQKKNESDSNVRVEPRAENAHLDSASGGPVNSTYTGRIHSTVDPENGRGRQKGKVYGLGSRNNIHRIQSGLQGIGSSC